MTRKERQAMARLEIENAELRAANTRHLEVYRDQCIELIDLRTKLGMLKMLAAEMMDEAGA